MWGTLKTLAWVVLLGCFAHADIGLMLGESTGQGMSRWTSAGHSAVYLSRVCPDGPVHLRLCESGEQGSVLSNYINFNEDQPYEWNVVPLSVFLYGVDDPANRPLIASPELRAALQERFRLNHLGSICPEGPCTDAKAHWRDVVAATFVRDIYMFETTTTLDQDRTFIEKFNALPNVDHYNGFTRNCADFARLVVNTYFPGAARPDHINDFWMTSPKAISKSFTHYAVKHPELNFHVVRFTQLPGSYRRSSDARKGTEVAFTSKKWFFPMLLRSNELMLFTASYMLTGRFNPEHELRRRPSEVVTAELVEAREAARIGDPEVAHDLKQLAKEERGKTLGTTEDWRRYKEAFEEYRSESATHQVELLNAKSLANDLDAKGEVQIDPNGAIWIDFKDFEGTRRLGVSASNVNSPDSDGELAYALLLAGTQAQLNSSPKNREMLPDFQARWQLLNDARHNLDWKILARQIRQRDQGTEESAPVLGSALLP